MIDNIVFVRELNSKLKYLPNKNDNSFYKIFKTFNGENNRQIRVSNHGTYLKTWIEQKYDPSYGINISIVFKGENGLTNDCLIDNTTKKPFSDCKPCLANQELVGKACIPRKVTNYNQKKRSFFVTQYVYDCQNFDGSEIDVLMKAIKTAANSGVYNDPFINIEGKKAQMIELQPIQEQRYTNRKLIENKKHNIMKTNRNKVRLTESQLHKVIKESVAQTLNEINGGVDIQRIRQEIEQISPIFTKGLPTSFGIRQPQFKFNLLNNGNLVLGLPITNSLIVVYNIYKYNFEKDAKWNLYELMNVSGNQGQAIGIIKNGKYIQI